MKILYVANHSAGKNDDEGAIADGFEKLGHEVIRANQNEFRVIPTRNYSYCDFMLCHHLWNPHQIEKLKIPKVFWCFDLISYPRDPSLAARNQRRMNGIRQLTKTCDLGLMSDGDWVERNGSDKLVEFKQGADHRIVGMHKPIDGFSADILFMGIRNGGGVGRSSFVKFMFANFRDHFKHVRSVYREALARMIASSKVVVAPDHPMTDRYWSNRIYIALGFGALLLHPRVKGLEKYFKHEEHLLYYDSREHLHHQLELVLKAEEGGQIQDFFNGIRYAGWAEAVAQHTYMSRCEDLINIVKERLL